MLTNIDDINRENFHVITCLCSLSSLYGDDILIFSGYHILIFLGYYKMTRTYFQLRGFDKCGKFHLKQERYFFFSRKLNDLLFVQDDVFNYAHQGWVCVSELFC